MIKNHAGLFPEGYIDSCLDRNELLFLQLLSVIHYSLDRGIRDLPGIAGIVLREGLHPCCFLFQIKLNLAPFPAVVHLISVGSGGYFFAFSLNRDLLEAHAMKLAQLDQFQRQIF